MADPSQNRLANEADVPGDHDIITVPDAERVLETVGAGTGDDSTFDQGLGI
jgi:hypothetical protein